MPVTLAQPWFLDIIQLVFVTARAPACSPRLAEPSRDAARRGPAQQLSDGAPSCGPGHLVFPTPNGGPCPFDLASSGPLSAGWAYIHSDPASQAPPAARGDPHSPHSSRADRAHMVSQPALEQPQPCWAQEQAGGRPPQPQQQQQAAGPGALVTSWDREQGLSLAAVQVGLAFLGACLACPALLGLHRHRAILLAPVGTEPRNWMTRPAL